MICGVAQSKAAARRSYGILRLRWSPMKAPRIPCGGTLKVLGSFWSRVPNTRCCKFCFVQDSLSNADEATLLPELLDCQALA